MYLYFSFILRHLVIFYLILLILSPFYNFIIIFKYLDIFILLLRDHQITHRSLILGWFYLFSFISRHLVVISFIFQQIYFHLGFYQILFKILQIVIFFPNPIPRALFWDFVIRVWGRGFLVCFVLQIPHLETPWSHPFRPLFSMKLLHKSPNMSSRVFE